MVPRFLFASFYKNSPIDESKRVQGVFYSLKAKGIVTVVLPD